jgi:hypothetical protein
MTSEPIDPAPDADLAELVSKYLDNRLDATQRERLESRIQQEPASMDYLAQRLRFEATLRETINPQRMEILESRRMIFDPGAEGSEWTVEQQRSVRIGQPRGEMAHDVFPTKNRRVPLLLLAGALLVGIVAAWFLRPRSQPVSKPFVVLRNADFETTDLSLSPQGVTSALVDWQDIFFCPEAELVEIGRVTQGGVFAKSGKNVARLLPHGYLTQHLRRSDGSPLRALDGLTIRITGSAWIEADAPQTMSASLRVIASGRPETIQYEACKIPFTLKSTGWQSFTVDLPIRGDLMREPFWVEPGVDSKATLDLDDRELFLSIDMEAIQIPVLLDDLKIEEILR